MPKKQKARKSRPSKRSAQRAARQPEVVAPVEAVQVVPAVDSPTQTEPVTRPAASEPAARRRRTGVAAAIIGVAVLVAALAIFGANALQQPAAMPFASPTDGVVVGTPSGQVAAATEPAAATRTPTVEPTPSPTVEPTPTAADETPAPIATPAPAIPPPPPVAISPPTPPATPVPDPAPPAEVVAVAEPDASVAAFYRAVAAGDFDAAYSLWSARMRTTYPRQPNLDERFADTASIEFQDLFVAEQGSGRATVQANFTEFYDSGGSRDFVGFWRLVLVDGRWLLDEPNY